MKKLILLLFTLVFIFNLASSVSEDDVCCERLLGDSANPWCQDALVSQCDTNYQVTSYTSCAYSPRCQTGTCVNRETGDCSEGISKAKCEDEGGYIDSRQISQIDSCQQVCCMIGDSASPVSRIECSRIANEYDLQPTILEGLSAEECLDKAFSTSMGACVRNGLSECSHSMKEDCLRSGGTFHEGLLCTAPGISDCAMTSKTKCDGTGKEDVHFVDSCGNTANIFDASKIGVQSYWTNIKTDYLDDDYSGDCDFSLKGTMCKQIGNSAACMDSLKCSFVNEYGETKNYVHGETWCYNEGALDRTLNLKINLSTGQFTDSGMKEKIENSYLYSNLPGSEYYLMECRNGEVVHEPCAPFRNEVCKEGKITYPDSNKQINYAFCAVNMGRDCFNLTTKTKCESPKNDCKWLGWGYRFDGKVIEYGGVAGNPDGQAQRDRRDEEQGSCVPLYPLGLNFWQEGNAASPTGNMDGDTAFCSMASAVEIAYFETGIFSERDNEVRTEFSTREISEKCFAGGCFAIPDYGLKNTNLAPYRGLSNTFSIEEIHEGRDPSGDLSKDNYLSERRGYYCHKKGDENATRTGHISNDLNCAENYLKRNDIPIFTNHGVWVDFLQERAKSIGDCGYKLSSWGIEDKIYGSPTSEVLTSEFQILNQDMEITDSYEAVNIYIGDKRVDPTKYRPSHIFQPGTTNPYYWRTTSWWKKLNPGKIPFLGNKN